MKRALVWLLVFLAPLWVFANGQKESAAPVAPEEFFKTHNVTLVCNGGIGGGTDFAARLFASYWTEVTGGAMVVKVASGGGGIEGLNSVWQAKPDGLTIGTTHHPSDMIAPKLLGTPGVTFDTRELNYLGFFGFDPKYMWISAQSPYKTVADLKGADKIIVGAASPASAGTVASIVAINILGLNNAEVVFGYEAPELGLSTKRGEILMYTLEASTGSVEVGKGYVQPFFAQTFNRTEWYKDVPSLKELAGNLTPEQEQMLKFVEALVDGKSFFAPPGMPADKLDYMRRSFDKIVTHPGFVKQIKVRYPVWQQPMTGEQLEKMTREALSMPPEQIKAVKDLVGKYVK